MSIGYAFRKIRNSIGVNGFKGTVRLGINKIVRTVMWYSPAEQRKRKMVEDRDRAFDVKYGTDTHGNVINSPGEVVGPNWVSGLKYGAIDQENLEEAINRLNIRHEEFTLIDLGSGKGRAVLIASRYPFKQVIGVEYSKPLWEVAEKNIAIFPAAEKKCGKIVNICDDASKFTVPDGPILLLMFNPFGRPVMHEVVKHFKESFTRDPRRLIILYFNAQFADEWDAMNFLSKPQASRFLTVFDNKPANEAGATQNA